MDRRSFISGKIILQFTLKNFLAKNKLILKYNYKRLLVMKNGLAYKFNDLLIVATFEKFKSFMSFSH